MRAVNEVFVVMFNAVFTKAVLKSLGKLSDLALGHTKCLAVFEAVLLAFFSLEESVTASGNTYGPCASL